MKGLDLKNLALLLSVFSLSLCFGNSRSQNGTNTAAKDIEKKELKVWQLPNLDQAAESYFSPDGKYLICNAKQPTDSTYGVYKVSIDGKEIIKINGIGEDACSFFSPDGKKILFTSTRDNLDLPKGDYSVAKDYPKGAEIYICDADGKNVKRLTNNKYYDAECTFSPDGKWILFARQIDGKIDLWKMKADGTDEKQITFTPDLQEGGAQYLSDNKTILYRAWSMADEGVKKPTPMKVYTIKDNGKDNKVVTNNEGTNWAPAPAPDGIHFVYVRVLPVTLPDGKPGRPNFEVFLGNIKTGESTRLTYSDRFEGFPSLSPDGKLLSFSSDRDYVASHGAPKKLFLYFMDVSSLNLGPKSKTKKG